MTARTGDRYLVIRLQNLTKRYGDVTAVDQLTVDIRPGVVTGFLGPNGSGKSTTMRIILGLDFPTSGTATINDLTYSHLGYPLREVGALLDAKALHPSRSARNHLLALAASNDIPSSRVTEVLEIVGLSKVASRRAGKFSLGMGQRLGIAAALLGDPQILLFDEPVNGLDPEGIRWVRDFFRSLANEGRTVMVSSHLMSEMALTADEIIVIGRGRLIRQGSIDELTESAVGTTLVRSPNIAQLTAALRTKGFGVTTGREDEIIVSGATPELVGEMALELRVVLHELTPQRASLEDVFMELTADSVEYSGSAPHAVANTAATGTDQPNFPEGES
jgi:ABC-2 type transport system ATP-binding protein